MNTTSSSPAHEHNEHAAEFPIRLFTALRTVRLYPPTNPQVIQNSTAAYQAYKTLIDSTEDGEVTIALSEQKIIVNGYHLTEKELARPQIVGLTSFLQQLKLHSLSFKQSFTQEQCSLFIGTLAALFGQKEINESLSDLLKSANIFSVSADSKRYVAVREGEQVVSQDQIGFGSGVGISDDEMASFILGQTGVSTPFAGSLPKELEPIISILSDSLQDHDNPAQLTSALFNALHEQPNNNVQHHDDIEASANTIANLAPDKLSKLLALLPQTESSNEVLNATIDNLQPNQLNALVNNLIVDLAQQTPGSLPAEDRHTQHNILKRLIHTNKGSEIKKTIALNVDAKQLLDNPSTTIAELPPHLLNRLKQPDWSAPVLANAVQQSIEQQPGTDTPIDSAAVNRMLAHYEQLLDEKSQQQVAAQAGAQLASMGGAELGNVLTQRFKGLFGDKLYHQVINQVSDDLLDETVEHLTPKQLNRMVAMMTSSIPLAIDNNGDPDLTAVDDDILNKLINTTRGSEIKKSIALNVDAKQLLDNPSTTIAELPPHLLNRLKQPDWSAPVLANAVQQAVEQQPGTDAPINSAAINRMLAHYEQLLDEKSQQQVAAQAGAQLASMGGIELGNVLTQRFKGLFGDKLYHQVINQVSDDLLDETVEHLTPKQLNRMVAMMTSSIPLAIDNNGDPDLTAVDDDILNKLINTTRGSEIKKSIALNVDAKQLLDNPSTTIAELPPHLLNRLKQPDWSAPVLANAVQQAVEQQPGTDAPINSAAINRMLAHYEQLLDEKSQQQVAAQAGAQLASMGGTELGNVLTQRFKGLFGDKLYHQVINQVSDDLLDETVEHLTPKQLNRMVAMMTSSIPLAIDNNGTPDLTAVDDGMLKRLVQTPKGPIVRQLYSQQVDAHTLQVAAASGQSPPANLQKRLQQPEWSGPLLVTAAQLAVDPSIRGKNQTDFEGFNQILTNYDTVLDQEQQTQVATQAGIQLAGFEDSELGVMLIQRFKGLFGDKLYTEVIKHLTDKKLATLTQQMYRFVTNQELLPEGESNQEVTAAYKRLMQTVKNVKIQTVVDMHQERQQKEAENKAEKILKGINAVLANDTNQLADKDICQELPNAIIQFIKDEKNIEADTLLMHTAIAIQSTSEKIRINGAESLAATAQKLAEHKQWDRLVKLLPALEQALQLVATDETSIKRIITAVSQLAHHFLEQDNYAKAFEIVHVINRITTSTVGITVSETVREHGAAVLDQISSDSILEKLLEAYLHDEEKRETAGNLLTGLGKRSARYQLQYLMNSESRFERKLLLNLIKQTGNAAKDILLAQIEQPSPWYVTRNIVRLLGEIGSPTLIHAIKPFINHQDLRVQQEVLNTAIKLGGDETPDFLKLALSSMDDAIKIKIVHHMGNIPDESYVRPLTELLDQNKSMQGGNKNLFQLATCKTLGIICSRRALQTLQSVAQSKSVLGIAGYAEEVRDAAGQTAQRIRARLSQDKGPQLPSSSTMPPPNNEQSQPISQEPALTDQEINIFKMVEQGKKEEAKEALFDLVTATARGGDFQNAERLRERIYEIDPMALSEIIRSGEIIEQEKNGAINQDDLNTWAQLTDELTSAEFQTIYHELRERIFAPEESIVNQGEQNDELLLINQGSIKASHLINNKEIFITSLGRGEIIGENFFTPSIWTINLTALTQARVYVLKQDQLAKWKDQFPGLEDKLKSFYNKNNKVPAILKKKGLERRRDERFKISRKIQVQPTDSKGNPIGRGFRADIIDISKGGLAFLIRITKKENAKLLLGRNLQVVLPVGGKANYLYLQGISIGVQPFNVFESDYAVHFKFHDHLDAASLQQILG